MVSGKVTLMTYSTLGICEVREVEKRDEGMRTLLQHICEYCEVGRMRDPDGPVQTKKENGAEGTADESQQKKTAVSLVLSMTPQHWPW